MRLGGRSDDKCGRQGRAPGRPQPQFTGGAESVAPKTSRWIYLPMAFFAAAFIRVWFYGRLGNFTYPTLILISPRSGCIRPDPGDTLGGSGELIPAAPFAILFAITLALFAQLVFIETGFPQFVTIIRPPNRPAVV